MSFIRTQKARVQGGVVSTVIATQRQISGVKVIKEKVTPFVPKVSVPKKRW